MPPKIPNPEQEYALGSTPLTDIVALRARLTDPNLRGLVLRGDQLFATFGEPPTGTELVDLITDISAG